MKITNPITLDVARSNSYICLLAKQFDSNSRYLEITLADNGQPLTIPADASAVLRATRADGTGAVVSGTVANGKATVEIDDYILEVNGAVTLSLEISKDGEILTTPSCNLTIQKADANGWIRVYVADANKVAGNYYITIGGVSYSFTTSQAIPTGGSVYFSSNNATAETRDATGTVIETGLVLTEGTTGTQLVTDVPTMSFLATIAGRVAALESEMPNKADKDGIIALANNLTPYSADSGATQSVPFINQGTGCGNGESVVDTGSYAQFKKKLGNTVCVNQQWSESKIPTDSTIYSSDTYTANGVTFVKNGDGSISIHTDNGGATAETGVKIASSGTLPLPQKHLIRGAFGGSDSTYSIVYARRHITDGSIYDAFAGGFNMWVTVASGAVITTPKKIYPQVIFLPLWFGSNDRIPSDLLSHPENFGRYYSGSLAYNPGQLVDANGSVLTSIGRNVWDEEWESGSYNANTGNPTADASRIRSKNYVRVIPNTDYYVLASKTVGLRFYDAQKNFLGREYNLSKLNETFKTPSGAAYLRFSVIDTTVYNRDITISLYYPGESGYDQYYPFSALAQIDTGSEVLRSAGAVADEKTPDGTITRNILDLDLGDFNWARYSGYSNLFYVNATTLKGAPTNSSISNVKCAKYVACPAQVIGGSGYTDRYVAVDSNGRIYINDPNYTNQNTFKTAMSGVHLYAEAATPTTEQGTPFSGASADNFAIDDFGSMYWTQTNGVPQGVEIIYPYDYKAAVDTILNEVNGDVTKLVTAEKVPDAPSSNGTYVLKVTVSDGTPTYSWVAE